MRSKVMQRPDKCSEPVVLAAEMRATENGKHNNTRKRSKVMTTALVVVGLLAVLLVGLLGFAATKPTTFRIERTARINAPPERIFALINDFHNWVSWSPFENLDPALKRTYSGEANGKGAVYEWEGNDKAGKGRMEITNVSTPSKVTIKLDFIKPFEAHNVAEFTLEPQGGATNVSWAMHGPDPYIMRVICTFFNRDKVIGKAFEDGLANLKAKTEI